MKNPFPAVAIVLLYLTVSAGVDHFPVQAGNAWLFSFEKKQWAWEEDLELIDSGIMRWEIMSATKLPVEAITTIVIRRTISLNHKLATSTLHPSSGYDSIFSTPRVAVDSFSMTDLGVGTGVFFQGDTCWAFVHDPKASIPAGKLSIRDTTISCLGKTMQASIIDPAKCRSIYHDSSWFIASADVGPVGYHKHSSPYVMDASWQENWFLKWTNVSAATVPEKPRTNNAPAFLALIDGKHVVIEASVSRPGEIRASFFSAAGTLIGKYSNATVFTGRQRIVIPYGASGKTVWAQGIVIMKVVLPDGSLLQKVLWRM